MSASRDEADLSADERASLELIPETGGIHQSDFCKELGVSSRKGSRKRSPNGTVAFVLKEIEPGNASEATVASTNLYPEKLVKGARKIASVIEDS